jgi:hypothetical protein
MKHRNEGGRQESGNFRAGERDGCQLWKTTSVRKVQSVYSYYANTEYKSILLQTLNFVGY